MERKEAVEVVKSNFPDSSFTMLREALETLIPELKESNDEKIRKALIENFKYFGGDNLETSKWGKNDDLLVTDIIAWLEKQGRKDSQVTLPTFTFDDILALECCMKEVEKKDEKLYNQLQSLHNRVHDAYWLGREEEQKSPDKVEPKFKVKDTIINIFYRWDGNCRIREIKDGKYIFDGGSYIDINEQDEWELVDKNKPKFKIGDWITHIESSPNNPSITEQNLTWSEEDKKMLESIIECVDGTGLLDSDQINWLKSIKFQIWWK